MVVACRRPGYLAGCMTHLLANPEVVNYDLWMFLDGPEEDEQVDACRVLFESVSHPRCFVITSSENLGPGYHIPRARCCLFFEEGYKRVVQVAEDAILAPYALAALEVAHAGVRVGISERTPCMTSAFSWCRGSTPAWKAQSLGLLVQGTCFHLSMMEQGVWTMVWPTVQEYQDKFLRGIPYAQRNHRSIQAWLARHHSRTVPDADWSRWWTSQDGIIRAAMLSFGVPFAATAVNHMKDIGVVGEHTDSAIWEQRGNDTHDLHLFKREDVLTALSEPVVSPDIFVPPLLKRG